MSHATGWVATDWETPYGKDFSVVDLGYWKYARDERCAPYLISVCDGVESWAGEVKDFNFEALRGKKLLSHNKAFDEEIALGGNERGLFDFPGLKTHGNNHWLCTLDMSAYLWNVRSLADACRIGLGITVDKSVRDRAKDKTVDDMKREGWWPDMIKYGQLDASRCWALFDKHGDKWPEFERRLSCLTIDQGRHGVRIDVRALDEGILTMQRVIAAAELNLPWVKRGRAPASPIGLAEECRNVGIPMAPVKTHDPEGAQQWEDTYSTKHKFVFALKNLRKAKKTLATLETIKLRLRPDETVAFSLKYAGAHTLRWAGDSGWNLQNQNKEPLFIDADYSFIFDKAAREANVKEFDKHHVGHSSFGKLESKTTFFDLRGLIIAREGMMLCPVDEAQIEPRVLNWLAGNWGLLEKIRTGYAIYEAHARETMPEAANYATPLKDTSKKLYALAKARCLAVNSPILTSDGYKPIQSVTANTRLLTRIGEVQSDGAINNGNAKVSDLLGEGYTTDHGIFTSPGHTEEAGWVLREGLEAAQQFRRDCSRDDWAEVWRLARYLGFLLADTTKALVSRLSVHGLWKKLCRRRAKPSLREEPVVPEVRAEKSAPSFCSANLGEANR